MVGVCPVCKKGIAPVETPAFLCRSGTCDDVCGVDNCDTQKQEQLQGAEPWFRLGWFSFCAAGERFPWEHGALFPCPEQQVQGFGGRVYKLGLVVHS